MQLQPADARQVARRFDQSLVAATPPADLRRWVESLPTPEERALAAIGAAEGLAGK